MRSLAIFVVILLIIVGAAAVFLVATTPRQSTPVHVTPALIQDVPASADEFAIIPSAAAFDAKLTANPITRAALEKWRAQHPLPRPWMVGGADLLVWKSVGTTRYFVRLDPFRAFIVSASAAQIVDLASRLPARDALVVQRESARGAYPPIARPAVTAVSVTPSEIRLVSVGAAVPGGPAARTAAAPPKFPRGAVLSVNYTSPPRAVTELDRLFGTKMSTLFDDGGTLCVYDVDVRKLLPRPLGVFVLPDDPRRRAVVDSLHDLVRTGQKDGMLLLSFDHSIDQYQKDVFDEPAAGNQWNVRIDPSRMVPILNSLGDNLGLRILAPRLFRSARDLDQWIGGLEQAKVIEASDSADSHGETLQVRIAAK
ncbi:MAG: hypothetical protein DMF58_04000 [Acidobacteria bacterium]|nr:MAG: hypothetical protein DMF58_04000 [Acidobacteriota bacterium]